MLINGRVQDGVTGIPVYGAVVQPIDSRGNKKGASALTDQQGNYSLMSSAMDEPGTMVKFSFVGYQDKVLPSDYANATVELLPATSLTTTIPGQHQSKLFSSPFANTNNKYKLIELGLGLVGLILVYEGIKFVFKREK